MTKALTALIRILKLLESLRTQLQRWYHGAGTGTVLCEGGAGQEAEPGPGLEVSTSAAAHPLSEESAFDFDAIKMVLKPQWHPAIATIVVTSVTMSGVVLRCRYKKQWHLLVNPEDWKKAKEYASLPPFSAHGITPFAWLAAPPMSAVPVVEDDQLGQRILSAAMTAQAVNQNKARLN